MPLGHEAHAHVIVGVVTFISHMVPSLSIFPGSPKGNYPLFTEDGHFPLSLGKGAVCNVLHLDTMQIKFRKVNLC